ncbi:MAG TPA: YdjY domain-containing protein [Phycisphaerales bacterium]|nr:YdjY domain-containing protein [Phycisphaerales bacterium]
MSFCGIVCLCIAMHGMGAPHAGAPAHGMREVFPGVRVDMAKKEMEFDGVMSPLLVRDEHAPLFYLEVLVCSPNTREHETLVVTEVRPSNIHAAMLAIGLKPGKPGGWKLEDGKLRPVPAEGDPLSVRIVYAGKDGKEVVADPLDWVINAKTPETFAAAEKKIAGASGKPPPDWVFAGSRVVKRKIDGAEREVYDADGAGTIVGLTTFGSEVIGWSRTISPDASVTEPEWVADLERTPPARTAVRVRISRK